MDSETPKTLTGYADAFDELLKRNRERLNNRMQDTLGRPGGSVPTSRSRVRSSMPSPVFPPAEGEPAGGAERETVPEGVRRMNERFGGGWSYEITERRREGEEAIVLCRVSVPEQDIARTQFGRARIHGAGEGPRIAGSAGGIPFSLRLERPGAPAPAGDPLEEAFQAAVEDALLKCAELL